MVKHYVYHLNDEETECKLDFLECCMFPERTDVAYGVEMVKKEIERRRELYVNNNDYCYCIFDIC